MFIAHLENPAPFGQACKEKAQLPLIVFSFSRKVGRESAETCVKISVSVDVFFFFPSICKTVSKSFRVMFNKYYRCWRRAAGAGVQMEIAPDGSTPWTWECLGRIDCWQTGLDMPPQNIPTDSDHRIPAKRVNLCSYICITYMDCNYTSIVYIIVYTYINHIRWIILILVKYIYIQLDILLVPQ